MTLDPPCRVLYRYYISLSSIMGLKINWTKLLLFPIAIEAWNTTPPDIPLQWVDNFKYLGVVIYRQASEFISLNLTPVLRDIRLKLKPCESLLFSLLGPINLLKMKMIPKFTYFFLPSGFLDHFLLDLINYFLLFYGAQKILAISWPPLMRSLNERNLRTSINSTTATSTAGLYVSMFVGFGGGYSSCRGRADIRQYYMVLCQKSYCPVLEETFPAHTFILETIGQ